MKNVFSKTEPVLVPCEANYSFFFDFIAKELPGPGPNTAPLHRICTLMRKMQVKCFVREELEHDSEIKEEVAALSVRTGAKIKVDAIRFTFFRRIPPSGTWKELADEDILGYVVLLRIDPPLEIERPDKSKAQAHGYILEAVVVLPGIAVEGGRVECVTNYYVHSCRKFQTTVGSASEAKTFRLNGTFFCQQNGFTSACAHAALRMAINSWPFYRGPKLTYEGINKILKVDHSMLRKVLNEGLEAQVIADVVKTLGYEVSIANFVQRPDINYEDCIYPLIESGCPIILGMASPRMAHVVAVVGHTLNSDRWAEARHQYGTLPDSYYISASAWADHFIVNDDNFGMYVTLPTESIKNIVLPKYNPNLYAAIAIGLLPEKPKMGAAGSAERIDGYVAENAAAILLRKLLSETAPSASNLWFGLLKQGHTPVCRTVLRDKSSYLKALSEMTDEKGNRAGDAEKQLVEALLPDQVWVTEIMTPSLYVGNKRKLGEILMKTSAPVADRSKGEVFVFAWLAGVAWHGPLLATGPFEWSVVGHVPLARGVPIERCKLEW